MSDSSVSMDVIFLQKVLILDIVVVDVDMIRVSTTPQVAVRGRTGTTSISIIVGNSNRGK